MSRRKRFNDPPSEKVNDTDLRGGALERRVIRMEMMVEELTRTLDKIGDNMLELKMDILQRMDINQEQTNVQLESLASMVDTRFSEVGCLQNESPVTVSFTDSTREKSVTRWRHCNLRMLDKALIELM